MHYKRLRYYLKIKNIKTSVERCHLSGLETVSRTELTCPCRKPLMSVQSHHSQRRSCSGTSCGIYGTSDTVRCHNTTSGWFFGIPGRRTPCSTLPGLGLQSESCRVQPGQSQMVCPSAVAAAAATTTTQLNDVNSSSCRHRARQVGRPYARPATHRRRRETPLQQLRRRLE